MVKSKIDKRIVYEEDSENWKNIETYVQSMIKRKTKEYSSLPSKSIFKYMDINDKIKNSNSTTECK